MEFTFCYYCHWGLDLFAAVQLILFLLSDAIIMLDSCCWWWWLLNLFIRKSQSMEINFGKFYEFLTERRSSHKFFILSASTTWISKFENLHLTLPYLSSKTLKSSTFVPSRKKNYHSWTKHSFSWTMTIKSTCLHLVDNAWQWHACYIWNSNINNNEDDNSTKHGKAKLSWKLLSSFSHLYVNFESFML